MKNKRLNFVLVNFGATTIVPILCCLSLIFSSCGGNGENKDADAPVDQPAEEISAEIVDQVPEEPSVEQVDEIPSEVSDGEEEAPACPPDQPPQHVYIDVDGNVLSLDMTTPVEGMLVAAISPMDALMNPNPQHLMEDTVGADGGFAFNCLDVGDVSLGLVVLADDSGSGTTWYPTGTGIKAWGTPPVKDDVHGAKVFGITETLAANFETLASMDFSVTGAVIGVVVDGTTGNPIDGAEVVRSGAGTPLNVVYPNSQLNGLEGDNNTSANGLFIIVITGQTLPLTNITASRAGYTFDVHQAASKQGFIYFLAIPGTPQ